MAVELRINPWPGGLSIPWAEYTGAGSGATQESSLGYEGGNQAMMSFIVNWADRETAWSELLGVNETVGTKLHRAPPAPHPSIRGFYADRIASMKPVGPDGTEIAFGARSSRYVYAVLTTRFCMPKWLRTLNDAQLLQYYQGKEQFRFCSYHATVSTEALSREPGTFEYVETGAGGPTIGTPTNFYIGQFLYRIEYIVRWHRVPALGLLDQTSNLPTNILAAVNTVNSATFLGQAAGTMLFKGYRKTPVENPDPFAFDFTKVGRTPLCYDVDLIFNLFDPPTDAATRGHQLQPWRNGKWYLVGFNGDTSRRIIPSYDHQTIFNMLSV